MAGGGWRLGHDEVARDPFEVREGSVGAHQGLSMVMRLDGEKPMMGAGTGGRWRCRSGHGGDGGGGSPWPKVAVHVEALMEARAEGI
jgi:hypothetical protein